MQTLIVEASESSGLGRLKRASVTLDQVVQRGKTAVVQWSGERWLA